LHYCPFPFGIKSLFWSISDHISQHSMHLWLCATMTILLLYPMMPISNFPIGCFHSCLAVGLWSLMYKVDSSKTLLWIKENFSRKTAENELVYGLVSTQRDSKLSLSSSIEGWALFFTDTSPKCFVGYVLDTNTLQTQSLLECTWYVSHNS
jgi:hypothetical protein